ncbi:MAG: hypothetical protein HYU68_14885 [Bacteroidetes bacterium]|nr:hypothetical protein [Bacteroidota bacterium]
MKTTIKLLSILIAASLFIGSCKEDSNEDLYLTEQELGEISRDSLEFMFIQTLNEIESNLKMIREKEGLIVLGPGSDLESGINTKEKILRNIQIINSLMDENRAKIETLKTALNKSETENKQMHLLTDAVNEKLIHQEEQINYLKEQLSNKNFEIDELNTKLTYLELQDEKLQLIITDLENELNTGHYIVGSYKELKEKGVAEKEGGVLWFGRTKSMNENFKETDFTVINIKENTTIPIFSKKAQLLSEHKNETYEFITENNQISYLNIIDPKQFWKTSKYLVIEIK